MLPLNARCKGMTTGYRLACCCECSLRAATDLPSSMTLSTPLLKQAKHVALTMWQWVLLLLFHKTHSMLGKNSLLLSILNLTPYRLHLVTPPGAVREGGKLGCCLWEEAPLPHCLFGGSTSGISSLRKLRFLPPVTGHRFPAVCCWFCFVVFDQFVFLIFLVLWFHAASSSLGKRRQRGREQAYFNQ